MDNANFTECRGCYKSLAHSKADGKCNVCKGRGKVDVGDSELTIHATCHRCNGTGVCPGCGGSGIIILKQEKY